MGLDEQVLTVKQLALIVSETISLIPAGLIVEGEIQKVKVYKDYMIFFELAGEGQSINCFTTFADLNGELPEEGLKAQLLGEVQLGNRGELRFRVRKLRSEGLAGNNAQLLEKLRLELRAEGLFDDERKRDLPRFPRKVAVITSGGSSAWEDFKRISSSRFLVTELELFSCTVQGEKAEQEICSALVDINQRSSEFDVVAIVRGGGAKGDLAVFNSEKLVRAVANSKVPVVSGVGHEDDTNLVDFVADRRASTPSNAAEIIFPESKDLLKEVYSLRLKAMAAMESSLNLAQAELSAKQNRLARSIREFINNLGSMLKIKISRLDGLDFEKVFAKGFALLESNGKVLNSVKSVQVGDGLMATLRDGQLDLEVTGRL
jgi:exodeoxyribonuclease VII large subunit